MSDSSTKQSHRVAWITGAFAVVTALITLLGVAVTAIATIAAAIIGVSKAPSGSSVSQTLSTGLQYVVRNVGDQLLPPGVQPIPSNTNYSGCSSSDARLVVRGVITSYATPNYNVALSIGNVSGIPLFMGGNGGSSIATSNGKSGNSSGLTNVSSQNADQLLANGMLLSPDMTTTITQIFSHVGDAKADRISISIPVQIASMENGVAVRSFASMSCGNIATLAK